MYVVTLVNSFINPNQSVDNFEFSIYTIMSLANNDYFISVFLILMIFISFSFLFFGLLH